MNCKHCNREIKWSDYFKRWVWSLNGKKNADKCPNNMRWYRHAQRPGPHEPKGQMT